MPDNVEALKEKPWLLHPEKEGLGPVYYGFIHEDYHHIIHYEGGEVHIRETEYAVNYYGRVDAILEDVEELRNFPGSLDFFKCDLTTRYSLKTLPRIYESMTRKDYIYKQDLLSMMQMRMIENAEIGNSEYRKSIVDFLAIYLRTKEEMMEGKFEFAPYDKTKMDEFKKKIGDRFNSALEDQRNLQPQHLTGEKTVKAVLAKMKSFFPVNKYDPECVSLEKVIKRIDERSPVGQNHQYYECLINIMHALVDEFETFIEANKSWFLPNPVDQKPPVAYVRVLKDKGNTSFFFGYELLSEMQRCGWNTTELEKKLQGKKETYCPDFRELLLNYKDMNIEKIITYGSKHGSAIPDWVVAPGDTHCISSTDFVYWFILWIHHKGYFQFASNETRDKLIEAIALLKPILDDRKADYRHITALEAADWRTKVLEHLKNNGVVAPSRPTKLEIQQKPHKGWTCSDLRAEMMRLGLDKPFPRIFSIVHNVLKWHKDLPMDLFTAMEVCMFYCVIKEAGVSKRALSAEFARAQLL
ncbi:unnamed protein product [Caenorhabditis nigoni]